MNRQLFSLFIIAALAAGQLHGAFLKNVPVTVVQPNGDTLHLYASGDEFYSWLHDLDQYTIIRDHTNGYYTYAVQLKDGIAPSQYIVGKADPKLLGLGKGVNLSPHAMQNRRDVILQRLPAPRVSTAILGTINQIVIFIRFNGEPEFTTPLSTYDNLFNASSADSISELNYFLEASYGRLTVSSTFYPTSGGTSVVSYQDTHPRSYFEPYDQTTNPVGYNSDNERIDREQTLLKNAATQVGSQVPPSLNLDVDSNECVDNTVFIIKGAATPSNPIFWPHASDFSISGVRINGKFVADYNIQIESVTAVGVLCHELAHTIGLPDLYHYGPDPGEPVGAWDLMATGGSTPQHMCAYLKFAPLRWVRSIPEITRSGTYALNPVGTSTNCVYKIRSPLASDQFYIVEFRRKQGLFESTLPGEGLLVYRIYSSKWGNSTGPPDGIYIYRPDGTLTSNGNLSMAALSAESGRTSIGPSTNPLPFLLDGRDGGLMISEVSSIGNQMTMKVTINGGGSLLAHYPLDNGAANDTSGNGYTGTVIGATAVADRFNTPQSALEFNGTNSRVTTTGLYPPGNNFSVSLWFKTGVVTPLKYECLIGNVDPDRGFRVGRNPLQGDTISFEVRGESIGWPRMGFALLPDDANKWVHLVGVFGNGRHEIYKNGVLKNGFYDQPGIAQTGYSLGIGFDPVTNNGFWTGSLDDVRIYKVPLSSAEVRSLYNEGGWHFPPVLSLPPNTAINVSTCPTFAWNASTDAISYRVQISTNPTISTLAYDSSGIVGTSHQAQWLSGATRYWWCVKASNTDGSTALSPTWSMTTLSGPYSGSRITLPGTIEVEFYDAGGEGVTYHDMDAENLGATYGSKFRTAEGIDIEPCQDPQGGLYNIAWARPGEWMRYAVTIMQAGSYRMEARVATPLPGRLHLELDGTNLTGPVVYGNTGGWQSWVTVSDTITLPSGDHYLYIVLDDTASSYYVGNINWLRLTETAPLLAAPSLISPTNGATEVSTSSLLAWQSVPVALWYRVQVALDSVMLSLVVDSTVTDAASFATPVLSHDRIHYWRVRAGTVSTMSQWSPVWNFKTIVQLPAQVALVSPLDHASVGADSVAFFWKVGRPIAQGYCFDLATDSLFVFRSTDTTITDTFKVVYQLTPGQIYWWRIAAKNNAGWGPFSQVRSFMALTTDVLSELGVPQKFSLSQNYPNPFNPTTTIRYGLPQRSHVTLTVFNTLGQRVATLVIGEVEAGYHQVQFDGAGLASGVYFYRLSGGSYAETKKFLLMR